MHIISKKPLREFWEKHSGTEQSLKDWWTITSKTSWANFPSIKQTFNTTAVYGSCYIFDVGGNKVRLIAKIRFDKQTLYVRRVLTHPEYDKGAWKNDC